MSMLVHGLRVVSGTRNNPWNRVKRHLNNFLTKRDRFRLIQYKLAKIEMQRKNKNLPLLGSNPISFSIKFLRSSLKLVAIQNHRRWFVCLTNDLVFLFACPQNREMVQNFEIKSFLTIGLFVPPAPPSPPKLHPEE